MTGTSTSHGVHSVKTDTADIEMVAKEPTDTPGQLAGSLRVWSTERPTASIRTDLFVTVAASIVQANSTRRSRFNTSTGLANTSDRNTGGTICN